MDKDRDALGSFVSRVQQDVPALKDAKVEYRRKDGKMHKNECKNATVKLYWLRERECHG